MKKRLLMPMHLQLFAESGEGGEGQDGTSTNPEGSQTTDPKPEGKDGKEADGKTFTRNDIAKMIAAETNKAKQAWEKDLLEKQKEAEKLAKMNADEKAEHERKKLEAKIAEFERKEQLSEMTETASEMISEKGSKPTKEMLRLIVSEDAEITSNNVKTYLASIEAEREIIKAEFEKRLGGKVPLGGNGSVEVAGEYGKQLAKKTANEVPRQTYFKG